MKPVAGASYCLSELPEKEMQELIMSYSHGCLGNYVVLSTIFRERFLIFKILITTIKKKINVWKKCLEASNLPICFKVLLNKPSQTCLRQSLVLSSVLRDVLI